MDAERVFLWFRIWPAGPPLHYEMLQVGGCEGSLQCVEAARLLAWVGQTKVQCSLWGGKGGILPK